LHGLSLPSLAFLPEMTAGGAVAIDMHGTIVAAAPDVLRLSAHELWSKACRIRAHKRI
jgi:hypothetical protein